MINNDKIFASENYNLKGEQSQEGTLLEKIQIGFGAIMMAWFLLAYVIMPIYRKTPLYKYLLKRKEAKEEELSKRRQKEYEEERKAEENAFEQIKNHPELKRLQSEITRTLNLANKFGKTVVPILKREINKIDPKHYIDVYDCEDDNDQYNELSTYLWNKCVDIAKAIHNKEKVEFLVDQFAFSLDGLKQYTFDESYDDSDNTKFNEIFDKVVEDVCNKMNIPITEYKQWKGGIKPKLEPNKIYYEKAWEGDHHGTTQSLINMVVLDFSK